MWIVQESAVEKVENDPARHFDYLIRLDSFAYVNLLVSTQTSSQTASVCIIKWWSEPIRMDRGESLVETE